MNWTDLRDHVVESDRAARRVQTNGRLYFVAVFLTTMLPAFERCTQYDYWPSEPAVFTAVLSGLGAATLALRAYRDGSYQRHIDDTLSGPTRREPDEPKDE